MKNLCVILPAFNEARVIGRVIDNLKKELNKSLSDIQTKIIVVDDGSVDKTTQIALNKNVTVLRHVINRGLGGALSTGLEYARRNNMDIAVTMDADGQHDAGDINKVIAPILRNQTDIVIGSRDTKKMPFDRRILTLLSGLLTFIFFGIFPKDSQSGFRAFNNKALNKIRIKTQRMEVSSELFHEIKKSNLVFEQIPIKVIYTSYSREKGQQNLNALKILLKLILRLFR